MSVIKTKKRKVVGHMLPINFVCAHEPLPQDSFVETYLTFPDGQRLFVTQTIDQYQAAVDWAVKMVDQMAWPIEVVPITMSEYLRKTRKQLERCLAAMTDQERGELRAFVTKAVAELMRDSDNREVRADAYKVLVAVGVVQ